MSDLNLKQIIPFKFMSDLKLENKIFPQNKSQTCLEQAIPKFTNDARLKFETAILIKLKDAELKKEEAWTQKTTTVFHKKLPIKAQVNSIKNHQARIRIINHATIMRRLREQAGCLHNLEEL